jgi:hypothetical protein
MDNQYKPKTVRSIFSDDREPFQAEPFSEFEIEMALTKMRIDGNIEKIVAEKKS